VVIQTDAVILPDGDRHRDDRKTDAPNLPVTPGTVPAYPTPDSKVPAKKDDPKAPAKSPPGPDWKGPGLPNPFPSESSR
jgi:hypothetical protein